MDCLLLNHVYDSAWHFEFQAYCRAPFRYLLNFSLFLLISLFKEIITITIQSDCFLLLLSSFLPCLPPPGPSFCLYCHLGLCMLLLHVPLYIYIYMSHSLFPSPWIDRPLVYLARTHMITLFEVLFFLTVSMYQPSRGVEIFWGGNSDIHVHRCW